MIEYILIILFIFYKGVEYYDNRNTQNHTKQYIQYLLDNERDTKYKYLVDTQKQLNIYIFIPGSECEEIGSWSNGDKTYFHKPNIFTCDCGYMLDVDRASNMI